MKLAAGWVLGWLVTLAVSGCYQGRDCKPGQACWKTCSEDPRGPGCVQPWEPTPIETQRNDGGTR